MANNNHDVYLPLEGGLSKAEGITTHKVELNNNRAVINTADEIDVLPKAVKAIRDLGMMLIR